MNRAFSIFILLAFIAGCTKNKSNNCACPGYASVSFKADIIPIFTASCAITGSACHAAGSNAGSLGLDSAVAYVQATYPGKGFVIAGNPNSSTLYKQLPAGAINHMPLYGMQLDSSDLQNIYCWIAQGALNN